MHSPIAADAGMRSPIAADAGMHSPIGADAGMRSPIAADAGMRSPIGADAGMRSPITTDAGMHSPVSPSSGGSGATAAQPGAPGSSPLQSGARPSAAEPLKAPRIDQGPSRRGGLALPWSARARPRDGASDAPQLATRGSRAGAVAACESCGPPPPELGRAHAYAAAATDSTTARRARRAERGLRADRRRLSAQTLRRSARAHRSTMGCISTRTGARCEAAFDASESGPPRTKAPF